MNLSIVAEQKGPKPCLGDEYQGWVAVNMDARGPVRPATGRESGLSKTRVACPMQCAHDSSFQDVYRSSQSPSIQKEPDFVISSKSRLRDQ